MLAHSKKVLILMLLCIEEDQTCDQNVFDVLINLITNV